MMRDLEKVKEMFAHADAIIKNKPELLSMHTDQIFNDLDDGTQEMMYIRWGVMVRAKMTELKSLCIKDVLDFLTNIKERNILCEHIGYILQTQNNVSLLELLLNAYEEGVHNEILPFLESCLKYEKDCFIDKIDIILDIISSIDNNRTVMVDNYAYLICKSDKEDLVFEKYVNKYSEALEQLISSLIKCLYPNKEEKVRKWLDRYLNTDAVHCKLAAIQLLSKSLHFNAKTFDYYFSFLEEKMCNIQEYWEHLIEAYIYYLEFDNNTLYRTKVKERLMQIKDGNIKEKLICVQEIAHLVQCSPEYSEIFENILSNSFNKNIQILSDTDYYLNYLFDGNADKAIRLLYQIFVVNEFRNNDAFLDYLPRLCVKLHHHQDELLNIWWNKLLNGSNGEFFLSVKILSKILSFEKVEHFLNNKNISRKDALSLLEGFFLFTIDENKIAKLSFIIATCIKDNVFFSNYCIENIFVNYSGALLDEAIQQKESENIYKQSLSQSIINHYKSFEEKIHKGYSERDFMPPTNRIITYKKIKAEHERKIFEQADKQSVFSEIFPSRKMKYGNKLAYIQKQKKGKYTYNVSPYAISKFSKELPKCFINNPLKYAYMKTDYLERRVKNATNS